MNLDNYNPLQGIYIHIPHCLQKCHYCDFATSLLSKGPDLDEYCELLLQELELQALKTKKISSIYFGGGTPSLFGNHRVFKVLDKIKSLGYDLEPGGEITFEINPGTLSKEQMTELHRGGINRFSVGVQTFNDETLKLIGREHTHKESLETLKIFADLNVNYTADLILALPGLDFKDFEKDFLKLMEFDPQHLSIYVLTVPEKSFLAQNMPKDDLLDELLDRSEILLSDHGFERYEISNYRKMGAAPSLHNLLYWNDKSYWGVGVGAHSYLQDLGPWGTRFWNPRTFKTYKQQLTERTKKDWLPLKKQVESLELHESLTDFSFTHLRQMRGLPEELLKQKFSAENADKVLIRLQLLEKNGYIINNKKYWKLSLKGKKFADKVFRELCFTKNDLR